MLIMIQIRDDRGWNQRAGSGDGVEGMPAPSPPSPTKPLPEPPEKMVALPALNPRSVCDAFLIGLTQLALPSFVYFSDFPYQIVSSSPLPQITVPCSE